jgi:hypothetical protein
MVHLIFLFMQPVFGTIIPLVVYCIVNLLFIVKYLSRIGPSFALLSGLAFVVFCFVVVKGMQTIPKRFLNRRAAFVLIGLFVALSLVAFWLISVQTIRVDRWSVITSFLDDLFQGKYPYDAKSNQGNPPGPFPFYFIIALPFYAFGEIGLMTLTSLVLFFLFLNKKTKDDRTFFLQTLLVLASPAMVWEIIGRSTIFVNFCLIVFYVSWLEKSVFSEERKQVLLPGLVGGLLLSTRAIAAIPVLCYLSYSLLRKKDIVNYLRICGAMAIGFCVTFVPLLLWGWESFVQNNPVLLQAGFAPAVVSLGFLFIACIGGLFLKQFNTLLRFCFVVIFCIVATSMAFSLSNVGWFDALYESKFDISYFILCIPFLIASLEAGPGRERISH